MSRGALFQAFLYLVSLVGPCLASAAVFIPPGELLTRLNVTENAVLRTACGTSSGRRHPWAVSFMHKGRNKLGGTIISPYHIITAAHGFVRYENSAPGICRVVGYRRYWSMYDWMVAIGDDCIRTPLSTYTYMSRGRLMNNFLCNSTTIQFRRIRAIMVDRGFADGGCMNGHDWAVVELDEPILFDNRVRPICLPRVGQPIQSILKSVGWGKPRAFIQGDPEMREIPVRHDPTCEAPHGDSMPTKGEDYVCAKALNPYDRKSPRSCYGDSGSGLEQRDSDGIATLVGVTSFGTRGCPPDELGRFTSVEKYLEPICKHTGVCYTICG